MRKNKRIRFTDNFKKTHPRNEGEFLYHPDKSGGHPVLVLKSNPINDKYYVASFSSKKRRDRIRLKHNIDPNISIDQYVNKKPSVYSYKQILFNKKYSNYRIHHDDKKTINKIKSKIKM